MVQIHHQWELFLSEVNKRETIAAIEANNDKYCLQKHIEKLAVDTSFTNTKCYFPLSLICSRVKHRISLYFPKHGLGDENSTWILTTDQWNQSIYCYWWSLRGLHVVSSVKLNWSAKQLDIANLLPFTQLSNNSKFRFHNLVIQIFDHAMIKTTCYTIKYSLSTQATRNLEANPRQEQGMFIAIIVQNLLDLLKKSVGTTILYTRF